MHHRSISMPVNTRPFSRTSDCCSALVWKHCALLTVTTAPSCGEAGTFCRYLVGFHRLAEALFPTAALMVLGLFSGMWRRSCLMQQYIQTADRQHGRFKMESDRETWQQECTEGKSLWIIEQHSCNHDCSCIWITFCHCVHQPGSILLLLTTLKAITHIISAFTEQILPCTDTYNVLNTAQMRTACQLMTVSKEGSICT